EIVFGDPAWADYNFVCEGMAVRGYGEISQTFRVNNSGRYEWVLGRWNGQNLSLGSVATGEVLERVWWRPIDKLRPDRKLDNDHWYKLEVRVRGSNVECLIDGESAAKVQHNRYAAGR